MIASQELADHLIALVRRSVNLNENSVIEYKVEPHAKTQDCELYKDVLGLLNSNERPAEDRWLIYGIANGTRKALGFDTGHPDLLDDANYREKFEKISPPPHIELIVVPGESVFGESHMGKVFAALYIPAENFGRVYELAAPVVDKEPKRSSGSPKRYETGVSFIRRSSKTTAMTERDRQELRLVSERFVASPVRSSKSIKDTEVRVSPFDCLLLIGSWDESNRFDRKLISELCGISYSDAVSLLHDGSEKGSTCFTGSNLRVEDRISTFALVGNHLTSLGLNALVDPLSRILTSIDAEYAFVESKCETAVVGKVVDGCSASMRNGAASLCACISNNRNLVPQCSDDDIERFLYGVIGPVFESNDWRVLASSGPVLPLLAEASPLIYLNCINRAFKEDSSVKDIFRRRVDESSSTSLGWQIIEGIRIAAIDKRTFAKAIDNLILLSEVFVHARDAIISILLPWFPQTSASIASRKGAGVKLSKSLNKPAWEALLGLLPNRTRSTDEVVTQYLQIPDFAQEARNGLSTRDIGEIGRSYGRDAIKGSGGDASRMTGLIDALDSFVAAELVDELVEHFLSVVESLSNTDRFAIWCALLGRTNQWKNYFDPGTMPARDNLSKLEKLAEQIKPNDELADVLRACSLEDYELVDLDDFRESQRASNEIRVTLMRPIYEMHGLGIVERLLARGAKPHLLGSVLAQIHLNDEEQDGILQTLDSADDDRACLAATYVRTKQHQFGWNWVDALSLREWPANRIALFFASTPCESSVWIRAERTLGNRGREYWMKAGRLCQLDDVVYVEHYVLKMLDVDRVREALEAAGHAVLHEITISTDVAFNVLDALKEASINTMNSYYVKSILKFLEEKMPGNRLFYTEWRFAAILIHEKDSYLFKRMAQDPVAFINMVVIANGGGSGLIKEFSFKSSPRARIHTRMVVLASWNIVPGYDEKGSFDESAFSYWINNAKRKAAELNCIELAELEMGRNFFHAQSVSSESFIPEPIADFLESSDQACIGYGVESFNSRGIHTIDETGKEEESFAISYDKKAVLAEERGHLKFAATLRSVADQFRREARRNRSRE